MTYACGSVDCFQIAHLKETCAKMVDKLFLETCSLIANEKAEAEASLKNAQAHLQGQVDGNGQHIARLEQRSEHLDEVVVQLSATASSKDELSEAQQLLEQKTDAVSTVLYHELQTVQLQLEQAVRHPNLELSNLNPNLTPASPCSVHVVAGGFTTCPLRRIFSLSRLPLGRPPAASSAPPALPWP
jgi:thioredoxin-like negative regulator of GroEL